MSKKKKDEGWVNVDEVKNRQSDKASFEVEGEVYTPYAVSQTYRFPLWIKACLAKWWFPGMVFYFIFFGFSGGITHQDILALILGLVWGLVTDIFLNHYFRDFSSPHHDYTRYILFGRKRSFFTLPINLIIGVLLSFASAFMIDIVVHLLQNVGAVKDPDEFMFAFGALFYATFMLLFDLSLCYARNMITKLVRKVKSKNKQVIEEESEVADENIEATQEEKVEETALNDSSKMQE